MTPTNTCPAHRPSLPPMPPSIAMLPIDERGYPVPFFVAWPNGKPDFRVFDPKKFAACQGRKLCWVCGERLREDEPGSFLIGPMCVVNRTTSEPPSHLECAVFSAIACPFLSIPSAQRREANLPDHLEMPGKPILRNPGVSVVYSTLHWQYQADGFCKGLFALGDPVTTEWYTKGRLASTKEALASINSGLPALIQMAEADPQLGAMEALTQMVNDAFRLVPIRCDDGGC